jgi:hypothetical protein
MWVFFLLFSFFLGWPSSLTAHLVRLAPTPLAHYHGDVGPAHAPFGYPLCHQWPPCTRDAGPCTRAGSTPPCFIAARWVAGPAPCRRAYALPVIAGIPPSWFVFGFTKVYRDRGAVAEYGNDLIGLQTKVLGVWHIYGFSAEVWWIGHYVKFIMFLFYRSEIVIFGLEMLVAHVHAHESPCPSTSLSEISTVLGIGKAHHFFSVCG